MPRVSTRSRCHKAPDLPDENHRDRRSGLHRLAPGRPPAGRRQRGRSSSTTSTRSTTAPAKEANLAGALAKPAVPAGRARHPRRAAQSTPWSSESRPDVIVHLAARAGVRPSIADPRLYTDVNVLGTVVWLEAACRLEPRPRFVYASSSSVYGDRAAGPFRETDPVDLPGQPLRRHQEGVRAAGPHLPSPARPAGHRPAVLHRLRPAEPARPGHRQVHAVDRPGPARADVRRRHDPARLHLRRRHRRRDRPRDRALHGSPPLQPGPLRADRASRDDRDDRPGTGKAGASSRRCPNSPATSGRPSPPSTGPARELGYAPKTPFREGLRRYIAWYRVTARLAAGLTRPGAEIERSCVAGTQKNRAGRDQEAWPAGAVRVVTQRTWKSNRRQSEETSLRPFP